MPANATRNAICRWLPDPMAGHYDSGDVAGFDRFAFYRLVMNEEREVSEKIPQEYAVFKAWVASVHSTLWSMARTITMMKHTLMMLMGCALPLLLIFLLPAIGLDSGWVLMLAIVAMFICHLMHFGIHKHREKGGGEDERRH